MVGVDRLRHAVGEAHEDVAALQGQFPLFQVDEVNHPQGDAPRLEGHGLGIAPADEEGGVVTGVDVPQEPSLGLIDAVEKGDEHARRGVPADELVGLPDGGGGGRVVRRAGAHEGAGQSHEDRRRHALPGDIGDDEPPGIEGDGDEVEEIPPDLPGGEVARGDIDAFDLRGVLGQKALLDTPGYFQLLLEALLFRRGALEVLHVPFQVGGHLVERVGQILQFVTRPDDHLILHLGPADGLGPLDQGQDGHGDGPGHDERHVNDQQDDEEHDGGEIPLDPVDRPVHLFLDLLRGRGDAQPGLFHGPGEFVDVGGGGDHVRCPLHGGHVHVLPPYDLIRVFPVIEPAARRAVEGLLEEVPKLGQHVPPAMHVEIDDLPVGVEPHNPRASLVDDGVTRLADGLDGDLLKLLVPLQVGEGEVGVGADENPALEGHILGLLLYDLRAQMLEGRGAVGGGALTQGVAGLDGVTADGYDVFLGDVGKDDEGDEGYPQEDEEQLRLDPQPGLLQQTRSRHALSRSRR